uniref:Uncharacterized protein n=1 Tax=Sphaerodactylus townsendi TaxID=933632 RepID=A0ACB8EP35_9SAUR
MTSGCCTSYRCRPHEPESCAMNPPELSLETLAPLHGPAGHEPELLASPSPHHPHHHPASAAARAANANAGAANAGALRAHPDLTTAASRSAMVSSMASLLDGAGDYRPELSIPLHHAMGMSPCDASPPGMGMSGTYTTLTPLQPLPPISTVSDKFHHPHAHPHHPHAAHPHPHPHAGGGGGAHHPHPHHHPHAGPHPHHPHPPGAPHAAHQRLAGGVSGSFTLLRDERGLPAVNSLYGPYKELPPPPLGPSLSPLGNGLGPLHGSPQGLHGYGPSAGDKLLGAGFDAHLLGRGMEQPLTRGLASPPAPMLAHLNGLGPAPPGPPPPPPPPHHGPGLLARERPPSTTGGAALEEINTKEVAARITAELKRYSIPQAIFAQRVLCRSQGTLSDLLRNPKPWSKLKSGRETFRRMWKWLQEPEFQRMSALRLAAVEEVVKEGWGGVGERTLCLFLAQDPNINKTIFGGSSSLVPYFTVDHLSEEQPNGLCIDKVTLKATELQRMQYCRQPFRWGKNNADLSLA